MDELVARARTGWIALAGAPVEFRHGTPDVAVSPGSLLCPPGWAAMVVLGGAAIATVAQEDWAAPVAGMPAVASRDAVGAFLPVAQWLGPATLAYLDEDEFRPVTGVPAERLTRTPAVAGAPVQGGDLAALVAGVTPEEAGEAAIDEIDSEPFVVREGSRVVAAAGYQRWPGHVAHLCVLTAADARGRGLGRAAVSAAVRDALDHGLLPQWRAQVEPSRRIARALGFRELGAQLSFRPQRPGLHGHDGPPGRDGG